MRRKRSKKEVSRSEALREKWKKRIILEKGCSEEEAKWLAKRVEALVDYMQYGHAAIAYQKQNGDFCLVTGTMIYYEQEFHRPYNPHKIESTVAFWNVEQQAWRTFQLENLMEWKPFV